MTEPPTTCAPVDPDSATASRTAVHGSTTAVGEPAEHGPAPPAEPAADRIGRWRILGPLGQGGMGDVVRASGPDGQIVALKRCRDRRPSHIAALRREAEALAAFDHPGIVRLIERGEHDGLPWYAMACVDGPTLHGADAALPLTQRIAVMVRVCEALAAMHRRGAVHRDVKPRNIVLGPDGPVLIDFGLVLRIGGERAGDHGWARDGAREAPDGAGTEGYRAPEQAAGHFVDGRADLFAVGRIIAPWLDGGSPPALVELVAALHAEIPTARPVDAAHVAVRLAPFAGLDADAVAARTAGAPSLLRAPLCGRTRELRRIDAALERARNGAFAALVLAGPSGIGKTRLMLEAASRSVDFRVVVGECRAVGDGLLDGFGGLLQYAVDRCRGDRRRTLATFGPHGPTLTPFAPAIGALPGQTTGVPLGPQSADEVGEAIAHVARALAARRPLLLLLDDLHWADALTASALTRLRAEQAPICVLASVRPEVPATPIAALLADPTVEQVPLGPLSDDGATALVGGLLGWHAPPAALVERAVARAEGNPLFVAEWLRSAMRAGYLRSSPAEGWSLAADAPPELRPAPIAALMRARLASLPADLEAAVHALAVLGRSAPLERVQALVADADPTRLSGLEDRAVCRVRDGRLRFEHDLLRAVAHADLPAAERRRLHGAAAADLEVRPLDDAYATARAVAHHLLGAGRPTAAGEALCRAARVAERRWALDDAIDAWRHAVDLLDGAAAVRARLDLGECLMRQGRRSEAAVVQRRAADDAHAMGDAALEADAWGILGRSLEFTDRLDEAHDALLRSLALYEGLDDDLGLARARTRLALYLQHQGRLAEAAVLHDEALAAARRLGDPFRLAVACNNAATLAGDRGRYVEACDRLDEALAAMARIDRPTVALIIRGHRAYALHRAGRLTAAVAAFEGCIADLEQAQMRPHLAMALIRRAALRRHTGHDPHAGLADLDRAADLLADVQDALAHGSLACERGHHLLWLGRDVADALNRATDCFARLRITAESELLAGWMLRWLVEAVEAARAGRPLLRGQVPETVFPAVRRALAAATLDGGGPDLHDARPWDASKN